MVTQYAGQQAADDFRDRLQELGVRVYRHYRIAGYPNNIPLIVEKFPPKLQIELVIKLPDPLPDMFRLHPQILLVIKTCPHLYSLLHTLKYADAAFPPYIVPAFRHKQFMPCVMGGVCMALYGFIAVSGLKMIQKVDLNKNKNLFVVSVILIAGIGGLTLTPSQSRRREVSYQAPALLTNRAR